MKKANQLTRDELEEIADLAQRFLYHEHGDVWNLDKDVPCGDFTMEMGALLDNLGMAPPGAEEVERKAEIEEFAQFVGELVNGRAAESDLLTKAREVYSGCASPDTSAHKLADAVKHLRRLARLSEDGSGDHTNIIGMAAELAKRHAAALGHALPAESPAKPDPADALAMSMQEAIVDPAESVPTEPIIGMFAPPSQQAAEQIRIGDPVVMVDGKVRLYDRAEAVKRLLDEFSLWSGGFVPAECSAEERNTFLAGRDLDAAQEAAMWPERKAVLS